MATQSHRPAPAAAPAGQGAAGSWAARLEVLRQARQLAEMAVAGGTIDRPGPGLAGCPSDGAAANAAGPAGAVGAVEALGLADDLIRLGTVVKVSALRDIEAAGAHREQGHKLAEDWRAATSGQGRGAAARDARLARTLDLFPEAGAALAGGEITPEHALALSRLCHTGDITTRTRAIERDLALRLSLLKQAKSQDAAEFGRTIRHEGFRLDASAEGRSWAQVRARRYLRMRRLHGGVKGDFFLDQVTARELTVALEAATHLGENEERTGEQIAADALADLAKATLDAGRLRPGATVRPHLSVILSQEVFARALRERHGPGPGPESGQAPGEAAGEAPDEAAEVSGPESPPPGAAARDSASAGSDAVSSGVGIAGGGEEAKPAPEPTTRPAPAPQLEPVAAPKPDCSTGTRVPRLSRSPLPVLDDGAPIPPQALAMLLCDSQLGRIVIDQDGQPINVGRAQRTATGALRLAVLNRDRQCRFPGCTKPARWADYHHIITWKQGGETSVRNGLMLCRHHHAFVHSSGTTIIPIPGGYRFHTPGHEPRTSFHATCPGSGTAGQGPGSGRDGPGRGRDGPGRGRDGPGGGRDGPDTTTAQENGAAFPAGPGQDCQSADLPEALALTC